MKFGMIGFGTIAPFYEAAFQKNPDATLLAISTRNEKRKARLESKGYIVFDNYHDLLLKDEIEAIIIATPNYLHAPMTLEALHSGKHVLCEKPMATTSADALKMLQEAKEAHKYLGISFHNSYSPLTQEAAKFLNLSKVVGFKAQFHENVLDHCDPENAWCFDWKKSGGGCVIDNGVNFIDVLCKILGPLKIKNAEFSNEHYQAERQANIIFSFDQGNKTGSLDLDWEAKKETKKITFILSDGSSFDLDFLTLENPQLPGSHMFIEYENILTGFKQAVLSNRTPDKRGLEVQKLVDEIYSFKDNK